MPESPFEFLTAMVGAPILDTLPPYVEFATIDTIRHFARAYGDDNPLYSDPAYASSSVRGGLVAPPLFPLATGVSERTGDAGDARVLDLDRLPGTRRQTILSESWRFCRPIGEGTRLTRARTLHRVAFDDAEDDGPACTLTERTVYAGDGTVFAIRDRLRRYLAGAALNTGPPNRDKATYSPEEISRVDAAYEAESRRGAVARHAEDTAVGEQVGPMVKGPLTVTDLVEYRSGVGRGPMGGEALRLAYLNRRDRPHVYAPDVHGIPEITERRHWDEKFAEHQGLPTATDYSHTRMTWFSHLLTDWMGDGGWVYALSGTTTLGLNFVGDTHVLEGDVVSVDLEGPVGAVRVTVSGRNQLDEVTCRGDALVLLPTRGAVGVSLEEIVAFDVRSAEEGDRDGTV